MKKLILVLAFISMAPDFSFAQEVMKTSVNTSACRQLFKIVQSENGSLKDLEFQKQSPAQIDSAANDLIVDIQKAIDGDPHSLKIFIYNHVLEQYFAPVFDLGRQVSQSINDTQTKPRALTDLETALYGASSLSQKVEALAHELNDSGWWSSKNKRTEKIKTIASEIQLCRAVIQQCLVGLPQALLQLNESYRLIDKTRIIFVDQKAVITKLQTLAVDKLLSDKLHSRLVQVDQVILSLNNMADQIQAMVEAADKVLSDAQNFNSGELQKQIIKAATEGINIAHADQPLNLRAPEVVKSASTIEFKDFNSILPFSNSKLRSYAKKILSENDPATKKALINEMAQIDREQDFVDAWLVRFRGITVQSLGGVFYNFVETPSSSNQVLQVVLDSLRYLDAPQTIDFIKDAKRYNSHNGWGMFRALSIYGNETIQRAMLDSFQMLNGIDVTHEFKGLAKILAESIHMQKDQSKVPELLQKLKTALNEGGGINDNHDVKLDGPQSVLYMYAWAIRLDNVDQSHFMDLYLQNRGKLYNPFADQAFMKSLGLLNTEKLKTVLSRLNLAQHKAFIGSLLEHGNSEIQNILKKQLGLE